MRIFVPLRDRAVARIWGGQVLSSVGDELNIAAMVWLAATVWGTGAGYLLAANSACVALAGFFAGTVVDDWEPKRTLVICDVARALTVATIPIAGALGANVGVFLAIAIMICGVFSPIFEGALVRSLPSLTPSPELLSATNALMATTNRFARVVGPGLLALLGAVIPTVHLFSVDAITFVGSAVAVTSIATSRFVAPAHSRKVSKVRGLGGAWALAKEFPIVKHTVLTSGIVWGGWSLVLPLGIGLLVHERHPHDVSALGLVVMAYGVGNLSANLALGSLSYAPEPLIFIGRILAGLGFALLAVAPSTPLLLLCAALAASGGPATDLGFMGTLQSRFPARDVSRVYRLLLGTSSAAKFFIFLASPFFFSRFGTARVIAVTGVIMLVVGIVGYVRHGHTRAPMLRPSTPPVEG